MFRNECCYIFLFFTTSWSYQAMFVPQPPLELLYTIRNGLDFGKCIKCWNSFHEFHRFTNFLLLLFFCHVTVFCSVNRTAAARLLYSVLLHLLWSTQHGKFTLFSNQLCCTLSLHWCKGVSQSFKLIKTVNGVDFKKRVKNVRTFGAVHFFHRVLTII